MESEVRYRRDGVRDGEMTVTRRGFIKRALTAAALVLVPSLPRLPKTAQEGRKVGHVVALPLHTSKIRNRALSDLEILEQFEIAQSQEVASRMAEQLDARMIAMLGTTGIVRFPGLMSMWDMPGLPGEVREQ